MHAAQLPRRAQAAAHEDCEPWEREASNVEDPQQEAAQVGLHALPEPRAA